MCPSLPHIVKLSEQKESRAADTGGHGEGSEGDDVDVEGQASDASEFENQGTGSGHAGDLEGGSLGGEAHNSVGESEGIRRMVQKVEPAAEGEGARGAVASMPLVAAFGEGQRRVGREGKGKEKILDEECVGGEVEVQRERNVKRKILAGQSEGGEVEVEGQQDQRRQGQGPMRDMGWEWQRGVGMQGESPSEERQRDGEGYFVPKDRRGGEGDEQGWVHGRGDGLLRQDEDSQGDLGGGQLVAVRHGACGNVFDASASLDIEAYVGLYPLEEGQEPSALTWREVEAAEVERDFVATIERSNRPPVERMREIAVELQLAIPDHNFRVKEQTRAAEERDCANLQLQLMVKPSLD